jgi:hypothetical protein
VGSLPQGYVELQNFCWIVHFCVMSSLIQRGSVCPQEVWGSEGRLSASPKSLVVYQSWSWKTNLLQPNFSLPKSLIIEVLFHFDQHNHGRLLVTGVVSQETSPYFPVSQQQHQEIFISKDSVLPSDSTISETHSGRYTAWSISASSSQVIRAYSAGRMLDVPLPESTFFN